MRLVLSALAVFILLSRAGAQEPAHSVSQDTQQLESFHSASSELVVLPITVADKKRQFVPDLPKERFTVYDNGRLQPIEFFSNEDTPVSLALVIDDSGSMRGKLGEVTAASLALVRSSNPADEVVVIEFNDSVRDALGGRRITAADVPDLEAALRTLVPQGRTALYDGLFDAMDHLENTRLPRKVIVLMSDGGDNSSRTMLDQVLARAHESSVIIYAISLYDADDPDRNDKVLRRLASTTGGERFEPASPGRLVSACVQIAREIRSGYTIAFVPPDRDGSFHKVRVEVAETDKRPLIVRTRDGYYAPKESH